MNNLMSYCGLVDARISASEKYVPVNDFATAGCFLLADIVDGALSRP